MLPGTEAIHDALDQLEDIRETTFGPTDLSTSTGLDFDVQETIRRAEQLADRNNEIQVQKIEGDIASKIAKSEKIATVSQDPEATKNPNEPGLDELKSRRDEIKGILTDVIEGEIQKKANRITSYYSPRVDPFNKSIQQKHNAVDLKGTIGTPVKATRDGVVVRSEKQEAAGNLIEVLHEDGYVSGYAHLKVREVEPGDFVRKGERIGQLGNTGKRTTGPHLHYRESLVNPGAPRYHTKYYTPVAPRYWPSALDNISIPPATEDLNDPSHAGMGNSKDYVYATSAKNKKLVNHPIVDQLATIYSAGVGYQQVGDYWTAWRCISASRDMAWWTRNYKLFNYTQIRLGQLYAGFADFNQSYDYYIAAAQSALYFKEDRTVSLTAYGVGVRCLADWQLDDAAHFFRESSRIANGAGLHKVQFAADNRISEILMIQDKKRALIENLGKTNKNKKGATLWELKNMRKMIEWLRRERR